VGLHPVPRECPVAVDLGGATGYVPVNEDALALEPLATKYVDDPRFRVAYDQLLASTDDPSAAGPVLGPQREVRSVTARAVAEIFGGDDVADRAQPVSANLSNSLLADYTRPQLSRTNGSLPPCWRPVRPPQGRTGLPLDCGAWSVPTTIPLT
jgi:hypothetical protein